MKVKEESEKVSLKLNIQKTKIMVSGPTTSWEIDGETVETMPDFILWGLQNHCRWWLQPRNYYYFLFYFILLYDTVLVLPYINITLPWVYTTRVPNPEPLSHLPPHTISLGHPSAPAPSIQYHASNLDWRFISYMIVYMFKCHSPKSSHPLPLPQSLKDCSIHLCLLYFG